MKQAFLVTLGGAVAGGALVRALLHGQWLSAVVCAWILVQAVAATEPTNTIRHHARRALLCAGIFAGLGTLFFVGSLVTIPSNRGANPIAAFFLAVISGAAVGGGSYVAITALRAGCDVAIARMRGHRSRPTQAAGARKNPAGEGNVAAPHVDAPTAEWHGSGNRQHRIMSARQRTCVDVPTRSSDIWRTGGGVRPCLTLSPSSVPSRTVRLHRRIRCFGRNLGGGVRGCGGPATAQRRSCSPQPCGRP